MWNYSDIECPQQNVDLFNELWKEILNMNRSFVDIP